MLEKCIPDVGALLDAAILLTVHYNKEGIGLPEWAAGCDDAAVGAVLDALSQEGIGLPDYLSPFCAVGENGASFLWTHLFRGGRHSHCTAQALEQLLHNRFNLQRSFLACNLPSLPAQDVPRIFRLEHPRTIQALLAEPLPHRNDAYFLYALSHFDTLLEELRELLWTVGGIVGQAARASYGYVDFVDALSQPPLLEKLRKLSGAPQTSPLECTLTLLSPRRILWHPEEPHRLLLGLDFQTHLAEFSHNAEATPYAFAIAIASPVKYDILQMLYRSPHPVTAAKIRTALHLSKSTAFQNLKEMQLSGLLQVMGEKSAAHYYALDRTFIRCVADQLRLMGELYAM